MLVRFTCDAYADITMFGDVAKHLLNMMGHSGDVPGALRAEDVAAALVQLRAALETEQKLVLPRDQNEDEDEDDWVTLSHRALPLLELLEAAARQQSDVMWSRA